MRCVSRFRLHLCSHPVTSVYPELPSLLAVMLCGGSDNARGVLGCALWFRPREFPRLYTRRRRTTCALHTPPRAATQLRQVATLYTLKSHNFNKFCDFICPSQKNVVYLRSQFHAGDVCTSSAGVADIFKRRLLRSVLTVWNVASFSTFRA